MEPSTHLALPRPRQRQIAELFEFATQYLKVDYIFWGTQEPYYSAEVIPFLKRVER